MLKKIFLSFLQIFVNIFSELPEIQLGQNVFYHRILRLSFNDLIQPLNHVQVIKFLNIYTSGFRGADFYIKSELGLQWSSLIKNTPYPLQMVIVLTDTFCQFVKVADLLKLSKEQHDIVLFRILNFSRSQSMQYLTY